MVRDADRIAPANVFLEEGRRAAECRGARPAPFSQRRSLSVTPVDNLHGEAVDTSTKRAFDDLETFAERSRRADEQTTLIAGMPPLLERAVVYFVGLALVVTLLILYFGGAQTIVETKGKILPQGNVLPLQVAQGGVVLEVKAGPGDHLPAGAVVARIDSVRGQPHDRADTAGTRDGGGAVARPAGIARRLDRVLANPGQLSDERTASALAALDAPDAQQPRAGQDPARRRDQDQELVPERRRQLETSAI